MSDDSVSAPTEAPAATAPLGAFDLLLAADSEASVRESATDAEPSSLSRSAPAGGAVQPGANPAGTNQALALQPRREHEEVRTTNIVDWVALGLAVVAPPIGVLAAIGAIVLGVRRNGFAATVAKVAVLVGAILTIVLLVALFLVNDAQKKQAAHDAVVASSVQFCTQLKGSGDLASPTYGFPGSQDTIPESIAAIQKYEDFWTRLVKVAPSGIRSGTTLVAKTAGTLLTNVTTSRVLDDGSNATQMEQAANNSGIDDWVAEYCK